MCQLLFLCVCFAFFLTYIFLIADIISISMYIMRSALWAALRISIIIIDIFATFSSSQLVA